MAQAPRQTAPRLAAMGITGLSSGLGIIMEEREPRLRGVEGMLTYQRMSQEPILAACLHAVDAVVRSVTWTVEPAKDDTTGEATEEAKDEAAWIERMLVGEPSYPWTETVSEALDAMVYGYTLFEIVFEPDQEETGRIRVSDISPRPQETIRKWEFGPADDPVAAVQHLPNGREVAIPLMKCLHIVVNRRKRSPEGRSMLRPAWKAWRRKERLQTVADIGVERDLTGIPVLYLPASIVQNATKPTATAQDVAILESYRKMVRDIRINEQSGVLLPSDPFRDAQNNPIGNQGAYRLELLASSSSRNIAIEPMLDRCEKEMARLFLADFLLLGGGAGSYALSKDKTDLFSKSLKAILDLIEAGAQGIVRLLWDLNGLPVETRPAIKAGDIAPEDVKLLADTIAALAGAGAEFFPDDEIENDLRRKANLPPKPKGGIEQPVDPATAAGEEDGLPGERAQ